LPPTPSWRRPTPASARRLHHRGHPDARHDARADLPAAADAAHRAELPGPHLAGQAKAGIIPATSAKEGRVGIVSKSGTLTYEAIHQLTKLGLGQTTCIGIGGDPLIGTSFIDALSCSPPTRDRGVVMIGEIGGTAEEEAAAYIKAHFKKPVVGFIAGQTAPPGRRMGHAGADHRGRQGHGGREDGGAAEAGVNVVKSPADIIGALRACREVLPVARLIPPGAPEPYNTRELACFIPPRAEGPGDAHQ
jgi:hypothetical protein